MLDLLAKKCVAHTLLSDLSYLSVDAPLAHMDMSGHGQQHIPVAKPCGDESH